MGDDIAFRLRDELGDDGFSSFVERAARLSSSASASGLAWSRLFGQDAA